MPLETGGAFHAAYCTPPSAAAGSAGEVTLELKKAEFQKEVETETLATRRDISFRESVW